MQCPKCRVGTRVISTMSGTDADHLRHLKCAYFKAAAQGLGVQFVSRKRRCKRKVCGVTFVTLEVDIEWLLEKGTLSL